jgi:hypothetical protein
MSDPRVDVALVPSTLLLLPENVGLVDPIDELRSACLEVTRDLTTSHPERVAVLSAPLRDQDVAHDITEPAGQRIARHLLEETGFAGEVADGDVVDGLLVVANGSARRTEHSPGSYDARAKPFDDAIERALFHAHLDALKDLDLELADALLCPDATALRRLGELATTTLGGGLSRAEDPFGVRYWVGWWTCGS